MNAQLDTLIEVEIIFVLNAIFPAKSATLHNSYVYLVTNTIIFNRVIL